MDEDDLSRSYRFSEGIFKRNLVKFLFSHPRYLDDIKFNDTSTGQIADNPIQAILGGHWEIEVSLFVQNVEG